MVGCEFQTGDGSPLTYNHNGAMHTGSFPVRERTGFIFRTPSRRMRG